MKKLLIISLLLLSVGLSQNRVNVNNLVQYGDKYFKENDDKPFNGIVFDLSKETGNKILEFRMVKGLKNGLYQEWSPDGNLKTKGKFINGMENGVWTQWSENGQKNYEENYKDGIKIGLWRGWYENGEKNFEKIYKDDKRDGLWTTWYKNGQKSSEGTFKDGVQDELEMYWYKNGQKYREITYQDGELINERYWTDDGFNNGELIFYFKTGEIWKKGNLKDGKREGEFITYGYYGSQDIYHKRILQNYRDGKLDGESVNYFDTGDVNVVENYKDGKQEGNSTYYDKDGKIYWEGTYKDDVLVKEISYIGSKGPFRLNSK